jgi:hypothetical protein
MSCSSDSDCYDSDSEVITSSNNLIRVKEYIQIPVLGLQGLKGDAGSQGPEGAQGPQGIQGPQGNGMGFQGANLESDYSFSSSSYVSLPMTLTGITVPSDTTGHIMFSGSGYSTIGPGFINFQLLQNGINIKGGNALCVPVGGGLYKWNVSFLTKVTLAASIVHTFIIIAKETNSTSGCFALTNPLENSFGFNISYPQLGGT